MGQILSQPVTEKYSDQGENENLYYGVSSMQGWRVSMEDAHATVLDLSRGAAAGGDSAGEAAAAAGGDAAAAAGGAKTADGAAGAGPGAKAADDFVAYFAVYDGHGGDKTALFAGDNVHHLVAESPAFAASKWGKAIQDGFLATDKAILDQSAAAMDASGCAATAAIITPTEIVCGNAGDSRTVLGTLGTAKPLSFDHKPDNEGEKSRIAAAGGFVDVGRVNGNLALSRALGDFSFKGSPQLPPELQAVTAFPDVIEHGLTPADEFVVLACDGIWDCMTSQEVVEFVRRGVADKLPLEEICELLMEECLAPESDMSGIGCDNMTVCIVALLQGQTKAQWYDKIAARVAAGEGPVASRTTAEIRSQLSQRARGHEESPVDDGSAGASTQQMLQQILSGGGVNPEATSILSRMGLRVLSSDEDDEGAESSADETEVGGKTPRDEWQ